MRPMFPSFRRSSKGRPILRYSLAILTTKLRFDLTRSWYEFSSLPASMRSAIACSSSFVRRGNSLMSFRYFPTQEFMSVEPFYIVHRPARPPSLVVGPLCSPASISRHSSSCRSSLLTSGPALLLAALSAARGFFFLDFYFVTPYIYVKFLEPPWFHKTGSTRTVDGCLG